jgi:hypothetical protein
MAADLVNAYYEGIARKDGWQKPLSDSLRFISPGGKVTEGKAAYLETNNRFLSAVRSAQRKEMLTDGDTACVWMSYEIVLPRGKQTTLDALEIWTATDNRLASLTIYFDTAVFSSFMRQA